MIPEHNHKFLVDEQEPERPGTRVYRILFLEDNPDDVELMQHELEVAGVRFTSIRTDRKADFLREVLTFRPDVILADYSLASFNGVQAFHMLKKEGLIIPFVLVTGVLSEELALGCLKDGIDDFVLKSSFKRLPTAIMGAVRKKEIEQEKNRIAVELEKSHGELRLLLNRQQLSLEEERMKIARDLHDELGQVLTALKIDMTMLWKKFSNGNPPAEEVINDEFATLTKMINKITLSVKEISSGLRPETLDELGVLDAIRWQVVEFERRNGITCRTILPGESLELNKNLSIALFRIVQETLTNVARHADANEVEIRLYNHEKSLSLEITDNGKGIEEEQVRSSKSLGIIGLRERVHLLDGQFHIGPSPGGGTIVSVIIPLEQKQP